MPFQLGRQPLQQLFEAQIGRLARAEHRVAYPLDREPMQQLEGIPAERVSLIPGPGLRGRRRPTLQRRLRSDRNAQIAHRLQMITGDLTIRGTTHEISFPAKVTIDNETVYAKTGEILLDRTRWGVNHMSKSVFKEMKDRYIDDEMMVKLDLVLDRQP